MKILLILYIFESCVNAFLLNLHKILEIIKTREFTGEYLSYTIPDTFVAHNNMQSQIENFGLDSENIIKIIKNNFVNKNLTSYSR